MGRSPCCEKAHTNKGAWTKEEDQRLITYIKANGEGCWRSLPKAAGLLRCGKSCRLRWINYLRPDLKRGNFTEEEDELIIKLHELLGNKWSLIAGRLPGRTDNEIKNYWNTHIKRKLLARGVDPQTHRPLNVVADHHNHYHHQLQVQRHFDAAASAGHHHNHDHFTVLSNSPEACSHSNDDEPSSATPPSRHLGIDLNLSISLAPYQPPQEEDQPGEPLIKQDDETASGYAGNATTTVCLCLNRLGLHGGKRCRCGRGGAPSMQASTHMFRFITPLDNTTSTTTMT
ncbi:hypothetical protein ABZP36_008908 [Zizania latifolia]